MPASNTAPSSTNLAEANRLSGEVTAAKTAFVETFNPVAAQFPEYKSDWTATDF